MAAGGGVCLYKAYKQHQVGLVPPATSYNMTTLTPVPTRASMLQRMKTEKFDLIVIGGGATGAGTVLDGATRGLRCALVEADDFGSGTSSRSTKLLHGGVRYLESAFKNLDLSQLYLVCEALEERAHLMKCAPYMSKPVPIIMPLYQLWQVPYCWFGIQMYDFLAKIVTWFNTGLPNCFYISKANALNFFPQLKDKKLQGALVYYDGQHNDARMNLTLALTSTIPGYIEDAKPAAIANHCRVQRLLKNPQGRVVGVRVRDALEDEEFDIYGRVVVNCTGPGSDVIRKMDDPNCTPLVDIAAGSHIILPKHYTPHNFGMIISQTSDERVAFMLPWENHTLVGTTDIKADLTALPRATEDEVKYILRELAKYLRCDEETLHSEIISTWSGLRPLVKAEDWDPNEATSKISRNHRIVEEPSGLISVMGGKWTTYRRMAQDALDHIIQQRIGGVTQERPCRTKQMKLFPAIDADNQGGDLQNFPRRLQKQYNLSYEQACHLVNNYGYQAKVLCELGKEKKLLEPLVPNEEFLKVEVLFAVRYELAQTCSDVLGRRLRVAFIDADAAKKAIGYVADIMAEELRWTSDRKAAEVASGLEYLNTMGLPQ